MKLKVMDKWQQKRHASLQTWHRSESIGCVSRPWHLQSFVTLQSDIDSRSILLHQPNQWVARPISYWSLNMVPSTKLWAGPVRKSSPSMTIQLLLGMTPTYRQQALRIAVQYASYNSGICGHLESVCKEGNRNLADQILVNYLEHYM